MADKSAEARHLGLDNDLAPEPEVQIEAEAPDTSAEDTQRPDYLLDKFNSVEEQAKAYNEAQRRMHEETQKAKSLEERLEQIEARFQEPQQPQQPQQPQYEDDPFAYQGYEDPFAPYAYEERLRELYESDPVQATKLQLQQELQAMQQQAAFQQQQAQQMERMRAQHTPQSAPVDEATSQLIAREAMREVANTYPDVYDRIDEIRPIVNEILPADKALNVDNLTAAVERAYKLVKADELMSQDQDLREQGVPPEEIARQRKLEAQTMSGVSARPDDLSPEEKQMAEILAAGGNHSYEAWRQRQGA